jgi:hypothetical protein
LRRISGPATPIAICLGNHDLWGSKRALRKALNPEDLQARFWQPAAAKHGVCLLDAGNADLDDFTIVGAYGHYDYSFACPALKLGTNEISTGDYQRGCPPDSRLFWNDRRWMPCDRGDIPEALRQAETFGSRFAMAAARRKPILVATHTAPFEELIGYPIDAAKEESFFRAYSGSSHMGTAIARHSAGIAFVACGHTHCAVGPVRHSGTDDHFLIANIGSDYGSPQAVVFDTSTMKATRASPCDNLKTDRL